MKQYIIILIGICGIFSCSKKTIPLPEPGEPVFYFKGTLGNQTINYEAGKNGKYLFTNYKIDSLGLYNFTGLFAPQNCPTCEPSIGFEISANTKINAQYVADLSKLASQNIFNSYSVDSIGTIDSIYNVSLNPIYNNNVSSYLWLFDDGTTSNIQNPTHNFIVGGNHTITLITNQAGSLDTNVQSLNVASSFGNFDSIEILNVDTFQKKLLVQATNNSYSNYLWDFGNGTTSNLQSDTITYGSNGKRIISLTQSNAQQTNIVKLPINFTNNGLKISPSFTCQRNISTVNNLQRRINLTSCIITCKQDGKVYKSYKNDANLNQSTVPVFKLLSFKQYTNNELGQKTVLLNGEVETYMYNVANNADSLKLKSTALSFAVAIP